MAANGSTVYGEIVFDESAPPFSGAVIHVRLEDVSRADAAAREVARLDIPDYSHSQGAKPLRFSLNVGDFDPSSRYELRVHADLNRNGQVDAGDQISTESYPVLTQGYPERATVRLRRVG
jgi:uncharacterized lipoprotein YbaY